MRTTTFLSVHTRLAGALSLILPLAIHAEDWPMYLGDGASGASEMAQRIRVSDMKVQDLWTSQAKFGGVRSHGADSRRAADEEQFDVPHMGGYASPIYADGKVFLSHHRPSGTRYDKFVAGQRLGLTQEELLAQRGDYPDGLIRKHERWLTDATDVLTCMDGKTGETLWETELTRDGINFNLGNKTGMGFNPAYHNGRVFVVGTRGDLFAVDAESGEIAWTSDIGERAKMQRMYKKMVADGYAFSPRFRSSFHSSVIAADGVVVLSDQIKHKVNLGGDTDYHYDENNGPMAFDAKTGERLWHRPEEGGKAGPALWQHQGKWYVVHGGVNGVSLTDLHSGERLWHSPVGCSGHAFFGRAIGGDIMLGRVHERGVKETPLAAFRLTLEGPVEVWRKPLQNRGNVVVSGKRAYTFLGNDLACIDLNNGEILRKLRGAGGGKSNKGNTFVAAYRGWLITCVTGESPGLHLIPAHPQDMGRKPVKVPVKFSPGYENVIMPAFGDGRIYIRAQHTVKGVRLVP